MTEFEAAVERFGNGCDGAHINRLLPVSSSCIMPFLIWRALASLASSAAISASMSLRMAAIAICSLLICGAGKQMRRKAANYRGLCCIPCKVLQPLFALE